MLALREWLWITGALLLVLALLAPFVILAACEHGVARLRVNRMG
jgi:hypothetical protein